MRKMSHSEGGPIEREREKVLSCRQSTRTWELEGVFRSTSAQYTWSKQSSQVCNCCLRYTMSGCNWPFQLSPPRYVGRNRIHLRGITEGYARGNKRRRFCLGSLRVLDLPANSASSNCTKVDSHEQARLYDDLSRRMAYQVPCMFNCPHCQSISPV